MSSPTQQSSQLSKGINNAAGEKGNADQILSEGADVAKRSPPSSQALSHDDGKTADQEWEIVSHGETKPKKKRVFNAWCSKTGGHFDITLGWGKWAGTVFYVDWSRTCKHSSDLAHDDMGRSKEQEK
ncbi:hypothetical protein F4779DRAFT_483475 [Xylariaceae sp. FL0662B]|nr:hypothetical protein F4779DRAFT_483475 [Xylariaceae sp. FL0662B]